MFALPDRNDRIARALAAIEFGERLAHACARQQLALASEGALRGFLREQARQEAIHASFFAGGAKLFGGAALPGTVARAFEAYRQRLDLGLANGELVDSLVGMQVVFEALGKNVLTAFELSPSPKAALFAAFRRRIAAEEASHHAFGIRALRAEFRERGLEDEALTRSVAPYRELAHALMRECMPLFADVGADCVSCLSGFDADVDRACAAIKH